MWKLLFVVWHLNRAGDLHVESTSRLLLMTFQGGIPRFTSRIRVGIEHIFALVHDGVILHILDLNHAAIRQSNEATYSRRRLFLRNLVIDLNDLPSDAWKGWFVVFWVVVEVLFIKLSVSIGTTLSRGVVIGTRWLAVLLRVVRRESFLGNRALDRTWSWTATCHGARIVFAVILLTCVDWVVNIEYSGFKRQVMQDLLPPISNVQIHEHLLFLWVDIF